MKILLCVNNKILYVFCFVFIYMNNCYTLDGITYRKLYTGNDKIVNVIEVNPEKYSIEASHASEFNKSKAQIEDFAEHHKALVAINGGFFKLSESKRYAVPAGVLKINDKWHGVNYRSRAAIGWNSLPSNSDSSNNTLIDIINTHSNLYVSNSSYKINGFNSLNTNNKNNIYSFGDNQIFAGLPNCNFLIDNKKIINVNTTLDNLKQSQYFFTQKTSNCKFNNNLINKKSFLDIDVNPRINKSNKKVWGQLQYIVGGAPLLIYNGKKQTNYKREISNKDFIYGEHARTAIGLLQNKNWLMVVVEENPLLGITGLSIPDLAELLLSLGCKYGINLDGGGSTSLYVDASIETDAESHIGDFSIAKIRPVSDAIIIKHTR